SELTQIRLLKEHGIVETLGEPQVVRVADGQRIEGIRASTGEAIALAGHAPPSETAAPARAAPARLPIAWPPRLPKIPASISHPRMAAIAGAGVALGIFVLFRLFSHSPEDASASTDTERLDAYVQPDLETRVLETIADPAKKSSADAENANEKKTEQREWTFNSRAEITSSPLVVGPLIVLGSGESTLFCLGAASGQRKWSYAAGSGIGSSPRASRNLCVVGTYAGKVL